MERPDKIQELSIAILPYSIRIEWELLGSSVEFVQVSHWNLNRNTCNTLQVFPGHECNTCWIDAAPGGYYCVAVRVKEKNNYKLSGWAYKCIQVPLISEDHSVTVEAVEIPKGLAVALGEMLRPYLYK